MPRRNVLGGREDVVRGAVCFALRLSADGGGAGFFAIRLTGRDVGRTTGRGRG